MTGSHLDDRRKKEELEYHEHSVPFEEANERFSLDDSLRLQIIHRCIKNK